MRQGHSSDPDVRVATYFIDNNSTHLTVCNCCTGKPLMHCLLHQRYLQIVFDDSS